MALAATLYHLRIDFSDVDRNVYQDLDLRVARHPSETARHLMARTLAYCLCYEDGIAFSQGVSTGEEPAATIRDGHGILRAWIDVGTPSAERLHKASKAAPRVVIFTQHDPALVQREARSRKIHRVEHIELFALDAAFLDEAERLSGRNAQWGLLHTAGQIYLTVGGRTLSSEVARHELVPV